MAKRVVLFLVTNLAIVLTVSVILSLLGVGRYVGPNGLAAGQRRPRSLPGVQIAGIALLSLPTSVASKSHVGSGPER